MFNSWAFKDVVIAIVGFGEEPVNCVKAKATSGECESSTLGERIEWFFWMLAMAISCTAAGAIKVPMHSIHLQYLISYLISIFDFIFNSNSFYSGRRPEPIPLHAQKEQGERVLGQKVALGSAVGSRLRVCLGLGVGIAVQVFYVLCLYKHRVQVGLFGCSSNIR